MDIAASMAMAMNVITAYSTAVAPEGIGDQAAGRRRGPSQH
jgi:hypothetical protein